jgi:16S rRNA (adenine1518-N6/adenine1519-N6)-dimethyltransferase
VSVHYVRPKKHLGQHFLTDSGTAARIAGGLTGFGAYTHLVEVGAGTGILTRHLLDLPYRLWLSEVDEQSIVHLIHHLQVDSSVILGDFLRLDLGSLLRSLGPSGGDSADHRAAAQEEMPERSRIGAAKDVIGASTEVPTAPQIGVVGNFPYHISSQILFRVLEQKQYIPEMCGMFQREVAQRICAPPGNKTYGILSVLTQAYYQTEYLFTVNEGVFNPPPKVKSGVIRLQRLPQPADCDESLLRRLVKAGFNQRRKRLGNALKTVLPVDYPDALRLMDLRAEQLSVDLFVALARDLAQFIQDSSDNI